MLNLSFHGFLKCQPAGSCTSERVPSLSLGTGPAKPESTVLVGGPRAAVPNCKERNGARLGNPPETRCLRTQRPLHPEKPLGRWGVFKSRADRKEEKERWEGEGKGSVRNEQISLGSLIPGIVSQRDTRTLNPN